MTSKTKLLCSRLKFKNFFRYQLEGNYFCVRKQSNINSFIYYKLFVNQGFRKSIFQQKLLSACKTQIVTKFLYVGEQTQGIFPIGVVSNSKIHLKTCFKCKQPNLQKNRYFRRNRGNKSKVVVSTIQNTYLQNYCQVRFLIRMYWHYLFQQLKGRPQYHLGSTLILDHIKVLYLTVNYVTNALDIHSEK